MKYTLLTTAILFYIQSNFAQDIWTKKANFPGAFRRSAVGFTICNKAYVGTGVGDVFYKDFWEYNPATNAWTQKANFAGGDRYDAVAFGIGEKGYVGTGVDQNDNLRKDFWEYDAHSNTWTRKANFGGTARYNAVGFSIGYKGYIGTGRDGNPLADTRDFWEYNPKTDKWTRKSNFGGTIRSRATAFVIGNRGYIGVGVWVNLDRNEYDIKNDFWEYNPATDSWTRKANFGGGGWFDASGFSIGGKGYVGTGVDENDNTRNAFWEYNPLTDKWIRIANVGSGFSSAVGLSIRRKGYIGLGFNKEWWEYSMSNQTALNAEVQSEDASTSSNGLLCYPIPSTGSLTIENSINNSGNTELIVRDTWGRIVFSKTEHAEKGTNTCHINLNNLAPGIYYLQIKNGNQKLEKQVVLTK